MYIAITNTLQIHNFYFKENCTLVSTRVASFMSYRREKFTFDEKLRALEIYQQALSATPMTENTPDYLPTFTPLSKTDKKLLTVLQGYVPYTLMKFHMLGFELIPKYALWAQILPFRYFGEVIPPTCDESSISSTERSSSSETENEEFEPHSGEEPSGSEAAGGTPSEQKMNRNPTKPLKSDDSEVTEEIPEDKSDSYTVAAVGKTAGVRSGFSSRLLPSNYNSFTWGGRN